MGRCARADATFLAALDGELADDLRIHAAGCADCTAAIAQAATFERELAAGAVQLAGPALSPALLDVAGSPSRVRGAWIAAMAVAATLLVVLTGAAFAANRGYLAIGAPAVATPVPARFTLHVVVSNHRLAAATVEVASVYEGHEYTVSMLVPGCSGAYGAAPLGDSWRVRIGDYSFAVGPPSSTASTATDDLTVRIVNGVSGSQVLSGTPADNGLDVGAISRDSVAPCR